MYIVSVKNKETFLDNVPSDYVMCNVFGVWLPRKECKVIYLGNIRCFFSPDAQALSKEEQNSNFQEIQTLFKSRKTKSLQEKASFLNDVEENAITVATLKDLIKNLKDTDKILFQYEGNGSSTDFDEAHFGWFQEPEEIADNAYIIAKA